METSSYADGYDQHGLRGRYDEEVSFYSVKRTQTRYAGCAAYEERMLAWVRMPEDIERIP